MPIFSSEFNYNTNKMIAWFVVIVLLTSMFLFAFPILTDSSIQPFIYNNISRIPERVNNVILPFGAETFNNLDSYFDTILLFTQFLLCIFALSIGLMSVAREQGYGTIDHLYINPVSRGEIVSKKYIANIVLLFIINLLIDIIATMVYVYLSEMEVIQVVETNLILYSSIFLESLLFLGLGTMISCFSRRTAFMGLKGFIIMIIIIAIYIALLSKSIYLSNPIFRALIPLNTTIEVVNIDDNIVITILLLLSKLLPSLIFFIIGKSYYNRKDLIV